VSEAPGRVIGHLDMDAFFASVEQLDCPAYRGQPVIVGGLGPRGVVSTASYEARRFGVGSAMPMAKARVLCPGGIYLEPRFERYREVSEIVHDLLRTYTPLVEALSLDEAFFDLSERAGTFGEGERLLAEVKGRVREATGLSCSAGLAPNRFLAKLASEVKKPDGLFVLRSEAVQAFLDPLPVGRIWGVGPATERRLLGLGLLTVADLRCAPLDLLVREFGAAGRSLGRLARGEDPTPVVPTREARSISREETLPEDLYDPAVVEARLRALAREVACALREEGLLGKTVRVKVRFPDFQTITRQKSLGAPTDSPQLIEAFALELLRRRVSLGGRGVRLIGVGVDRLFPVAGRQLSLFDEV